VDCLGFQPLQVSQVGQGHICSDIWLALDLTRRALADTPQMGVSLQNDRKQ
jgi:hypothetical protein